VKLNLVQTPYIIFMLIPVCIFGGETGFIHICLFYLRCLKILTFLSFQLNWTTEKSLRMTDFAVFRTPTSSFAVAYEISRDLVFTLFNIDLCLHSLF
jgi:hypothetical protein